MPCGLNDYQTSIHETFYRRKPDGWVSGLPASNQVSCELDVAMDPLQA